MRIPYRLSRATDWILSAFGVDTKVIAADGLQFRVQRFCGPSRPDEWFVHNIVNRREYNPLGYEIKPYDTVVDIGGNIGVFAVLAARTAKRVISVEPSSRNCRLMQDNVRLNRLTNIEIVQGAVMDRSGQGALSLSGPGYHSTTFKKSDKSETVRFVTLAELFDTFAIDRCDFLKVDCEGAEFPIFRNLEPSLWPRIHRIALEWHAESNADADVSCNELVQVFVSAGFMIDAYSKDAGFSSGHIFATRHIAS
jgi:FkbM family methyltransferase